MDATLLVQGIGAASAFVAAGAGIDALAGAQVRRRAAIGADRKGAGWMAWRMRRGYRPLRGAARAVLRWGWASKAADGAVRALADKGVLSDACAVASVGLAAMLAAAAAAGALSRSAVGALAAGAACAVGMGMAASASDERRRACACEAMPETLACMAGCFGAGYTLVQTLSQVAGESKPPLAGEFERAAHALQTGATAREALDLLRSGPYARELAFVAVALDVQHQAGGSVKQVLDAAADSVRSELDLKRDVRVQTAQAKLSCRIVSAMPLVLIAVFSIVSPGFADPFFESALGMALFAVALAMQAAGVLLVHRALQVGEGAS